MSQILAGPLASYNSLLDPSLQAYFGNARMRKHLRKAGLVRKSGQIIPEETIRVNFAKKVHVEHVKDLLAREVIYKVLDIERKRQVVIKNELEWTAKKELVQRVQSDLSHKSDEDILPFMSLRPSTAPVRRSSWVRQVRPVSGQPCSQTICPSSTSSFSTVDSSKGAKGRYRKGHKKPISVADFRHTGLADKHLCALDQQALWTITMGELIAGLTPTSAYLLPQPSPLPPTPNSGHRSPSHGRRSHRITHPSDSHGKSTKLQNNKWIVEIPKLPHSGQPGYTGSRRGSRPKIWRPKSEGMQRPKSEGTQRPKSEGSRDQSLKACRD